MKNLNHISIDDLILFIKGEIKTDLKWNEEKLQEIAFHLSDCQECCKTLAHLEFILKNKKNFDFAWDKCFPLETEEENVTEKIKGWIKLAIYKANEDFKKKLLIIETRIEENTGEIADLIIPVVVTTKGSGESIEITKTKGLKKIGNLVLHYEKKIGLDLFNSIELKDGILYLLSIGHPGFNEAILIEEDGSFVKSDLIQSDKGFLFIFRGIDSKECFLRFEKTRNII